MNTMKPNVSVKEDAREAKQVARSAATSKWMSWLARLGYAVKGVLYVIIGVLAAQLAIGQGGKATDQAGALQTISNQPFGKVLIIVIIIGMIGFGLWSIIQGVFDTEGEGRKAKGIVARIGYGVVGVAYLILASGALGLVTGSGSGPRNSTTTAQDSTALLLKQPFGIVLVVILGLVMIGVALYMFYKAYSANFRRHFNLITVSARLRNWIINMGRFGYASIGVVFSIIGIFLIVAAVEHNPHQAKGLDSALKALAHEPLGSVLLAIVALGLIAYGIYSFVEARYRLVGRG
jgi:hypothetical protein